MSVIEASTEVEAPLRATYDQWTQFEEFPRFMEGVQEVRQLDDTTLHWVVSVAGVRREWDARITEQVPDQLVAWTSIGGTRNDGVVTFESAGPGRTVVNLRLEVEPDGVLESVGDALGVVQARARADLGRFRRFMEEHRWPTGAWRGEVDGGEVVGSGDDDPVARPGGPAPLDEGELDPPGEVPASTGGVVDLDRILGNIPVVLVFMSDLQSPPTQEVLRSLGEHLVDFGHERTQVLAVAQVRPGEALEAAAESAGNARVLADPDGALAARYGVRFGPGRCTTVVVGADGEVAATWIDTAGGTFAEDLLARISQLVTG